MPVEAEGVVPKVILSRSALDFGSKVARRSLQGGKSPHVFDVQLRNNTDGPLQLSIGCPAAASAFLKPNTGSSGTDAGSKQQAAGKQQGDVPASSAYTVEGWDTRPSAPFVSLGPEESLGFSMRFSPTEARLYEACVPVYLGDSRASPYMLVQLTGIGTLPRLTFDVAECVLPLVSLSLAICRPTVGTFVWVQLSSCTGDMSACMHKLAHKLHMVCCRSSLVCALAAPVPDSQPGTSRTQLSLCDCSSPPPAQVPLGVASTRRVYVVNDGYDNLELSVRLPPDSGRLPVSVSFPEGKLIGLAKERLPLEVRCCASRPLGFTTCVDLLDEDGRAFSLVVTGAADNCSLSHGVFSRVRQMGVAGGVQAGRAAASKPLQLQPCLQASSTVKSAC